MRRSQPQLDPLDPVTTFRCRTGPRLPKMINFYRIDPFLQVKLHSCNLNAEISARHKMCSVMLRQSIHVVFRHELRSA